MNTKSKVNGENMIELLATSIVASNSQKTKDIITRILHGNQLTFPDFFSQTEINPQAERDILRSFRLASKDKGIGYDLILSSYGRHPDFYDVAMRMMSDNPKEALNNLEPRPFLPIRPHKAIRFNSPEEAWEKTKGGNWLVEPKFDGWYCQIHAANGQVRFISRNGKSIDFIMINENSKIRKFLSTKNIILEAEVVPIDQESGEIRPVKDITIKGIHHRAYVFDILYHDINLMNEPFRERRKYLEKLFINFSEQYLRLIEQRIVTDLNGFILTFSKMMELHLEGMMAKRPDANYRPLSQTHNFIKIKTKETVDAIVVGYIHEPRSYLVALWNEEQDQFEPFAWLPIRNNEVVALLDRYIDDSLLPISTEYKTTDTRIRPEIVVEVEGDKIFPSNQFSCGKALTGQGWSLHAARIVRVREDKSPNEVTSIAEFLALPRMSGYSDYS